jgi:hypothetical protein
MSTTESAESVKLIVAGKKMNQYRDITVRNAMKLSDFSDAKINDKNMQRKVLRRLPGKGKRAFKTKHMPSSHTAAKGIAEGVASVVDVGS